MKSKITAIILASFVLFVSSCTKQGITSILNVPGNILPNPPVVKPNQVFYAISSSNQLLRLNANNSETVQASVNITGLQVGETILGIDFRPATGELYGLGSSSRLYIINLSTGASRAVNATPFAPALTGTSVGFDFNPTVDRIRVVGNDGQNLRLNPETGLVAATDGAINGVAGALVTSVAYTNNSAGATSTTLYDIEISTKKLYKQNPPNNGTLAEVGDLGVAASASGGFDISPDGTVALATLNVGGETGLYRIDTLSGKATRLGNFGSAGASLIGIAIPTTPVAYAVDNANTLLIINPLINTTPVSKAITGIGAGESILGIDMRPLNGQLYALGSTSRLYTINLSSGAATPVGAAGLFTLAGTNFGFDFNPTVDRIRLVSNTGQNLRLNPTDGSLSATDASLNPGTPDVSAAAYTNNFAGATTTVLHVIDATADRLYTQNPPNNGTLVMTGPLGIDITGSNGFDIGSTSGIAVGIFTVGGVSSLYTVNLASGTATKGFDLNLNIRGFSLGLGF